MRINGKVLNVNSIVTAIALALAAIAAQSPLF